MHSLRVSLWLTRPAWVCLMHLYTLSRISQTESDIRTMRERHEADLKTHMEALLAARFPCPCCRCCAYILYHIISSCTVLFVSWPCTYVCACMFALPDRHATVSMCCAVHARFHVIIRDLGSRTPHSSCSACIEELIEQIHYLLWWWWWWWWCGLQEGRSARVYNHHPRARP